MKRTIPALVAFSLGAALAMPALAQTKNTTDAPTKVTDAEGSMKAVKATAVVTAIDLKNRILTLKGPEGNEFAVHVDAAVKNLPQVKVGDNVTVEFFESVALDFQKGDGIRMATVTDESAVAKAGKRPGASAATRVTTVSNIWAINATKGTVLVRGPFGHFTEVKLKDPSLLTGVKVGDQMKLTFTKAVAIAVTPAKS